MAASPRNYSGSLSDPLVEMLAAVSTHHRVMGRMQENFPEIRVAQADKVAELLIDVEASLRQMNLWQDEPPPAEALASTQPFAIDTLGFDQWLQFIFLPTMYHLIENDLKLPTDCAIAPMAEEYFRGSDQHSKPLEWALEEIDRLLTS